MIPSNLTCKNTFFDIPEETDVPEGPATWPKTSWWRSSSSRAAEWLDSQVYTLSEPEPSMLSSPEVWPYAEALGALPAPPMGSPMPPSPDFFERRGFDARFTFGAHLVGRTSPGMTTISESTDGPGEGCTPSLTENSTTPLRLGSDYFDDTPTPSPLDKTYGHSPSHFEGLMKKDLARTDPAPTRPPEQPPTLPAARCVLHGATGYGLWLHSHAFLMEAMEQQVGHDSQKAQRKKTLPKPLPQGKGPLPAGLLLPGQVHKIPTNDEDSPGRLRRKRGNREGKEVEFRSDDPYNSMPSAAFIDLGLLERQPPRPQP
ncbi:Uncharacterized protein SCF082_LOCUS47261 [Durusdinium trenchii]|uniref:Uncharacterized protein n=1 Tax=Durusdinium trenchii TaxID=1381693 RepID=A0ABP0RLA8_9DINO